MCPYLEAVFAVVQRIGGCRKQVALSLEKDATSMIINLLAKRVAYVYKASMLESNLV
jgi:hypothetical protein